MAIKRILKINDSWPELFNFQNSFGCHIFSLIIMKLGQDVCRYEISDGFKNGSLGQILEKSRVHSRGLIFSPIIMKLSQNV